MAAAAVTHAHVSNATKKRGACRLLLMTGGRGFSPDKTTDAPLRSWPESASELYRPSDRRLLAKLVPTFADRGCRVVSVTYLQMREGATTKS
jgi:hypothetical protein